MEGSVPSRNNRVHVETALIFITPAARHATDGRRFRRILWKTKINVAKPVYITMIGLGRVSILTLMTERISLIQDTDAAVGRSGRTIMTNKDIEEMKRNIDEIVSGLKNKEDENARLKETVKSQREKIDSLLKELQEEKGKTITFVDGGITMRADMWEALNENKELKDKNNALKQRIKDMEDACNGSCFSDYEDLPFGDDERDNLIAELQDQHQKDCIKINQLHVTIDTLVDKYSRLRNTVRMD